MTMLLDLLERRESHTKLAYKSYQTCTSGHTPVRNEYKLTATFRTYGTNADDLFFLTMALDTKKICPCQANHGLQAKRIFKNIPCVQCMASCMEKCRSLKSISALASKRKKDKNTPPSQADAGLTDKVECNEFHEHRVMG